MAAPRSRSHPMVIVRQDDAEVDVRGWARLYVTTLLSQERITPASPAAPPPTELPEAS
jgi:hypothetical protein